MFTEREMQSDVRELIESMEPSTFRYHESHLLERQEGVDERPAVSRVRARTFSPERPFVLAIVSAPGLGRTTVAANLASLLAQENRRVAVMQFEASPALARLFGLRGGASGRSPGADTGCIQRGPASVFSPQENHRDIEARTAWLSRVLQSLTAEDAEFVLLDVPSGDPALLRQIIEQSDQVLAVLGVEGDTRTATEEMLALLDTCEGPPAGYLVNRFDGRRRPQRESLAWLKNVLGPRLLPFVLQSDIVVTEAHQEQQFLVELAPASQVVADLCRLAAWCVALREESLRLRDPE